MPTVQTLLMFATASLALAVIPGPTMRLARSSGMEMLALTLAHVHQRAA